MKDKFKINKTALTGIVALVALVGFMVWTETPSDNFRCPNDYRTADEYINGMAQWITDELKNGPEITREELLDKRATLFNENDCEKSKWTDEIFDEPEKPVSGDEVVAVVAGYKTAL